LPHVRASYAAGLQSKKQSETVPFKEYWFAACKSIVCRGPAKQETEPVTSGWRAAAHFVFAPALLSLIKAAPRNEPAFQTENSNLIDLETTRHETLSPVTESLSRRCDTDADARPTQLSSIASYRMDANQTPKKNSATTESLSRKQRENQVFEQKTDMMPPAPLPVPDKPIHAFPSVTAEPSKPD
jgi:hypothetical protein